MQDGRRILHPACLVSAAAIAMIAAMAGCSSEGPESPWSSGTGDISGTVTSSRGGTLSGIDVCLCNERGEVTQETTTDGSGHYWLGDISLSEPQESSETFWIYANRVRASTDPIDGDYGTFGNEVAVQEDAVVTLDVVLEEMGPGDPTEYVGP